jgi:hypothetical protein
MLGVVLVVAANAFAARRTPSPQPVRRAGLVVRGSVDGLYPGARRRLVVVVRNRLPMRLRIVGLRVRVGDAGRACRARNLHIGLLRTHASVAARGVVKVRLRATLRRSAPDSCQGARFPLRFQVTAVRP